MSVNFNFSNLANTLKYLKNPNIPTGTMLIEAPADVGRAHSAYQRGGFIEAKEKFTKEVLSACVWLSGIPLFNKAGNVLFEKITKLPMDIDYSKAKDGRDCIRDSVEFLLNNNSKGLDVSELEKYKGVVKINDVEKAISTIKKSKQGVAIAAWALNCVLMGVVLPKIYQGMTRRTLEKQKKEKEKNATALIPETMKDFQKRTSKSNNVSFTGFGDWMTYNLNASNTFRLISTDLPMIAGRCATSRNKYEAYEILLMDSAAIYFYNFCSSNVQSILRKISATPNISSTVAECISQLQPNELEKVLAQIDENKPAKKVEELFSKEVAREIYKQGTNDRFGKINKFVQDKELTEIDENVQSFLAQIKAKGLIKNGVIDVDKLKKLVKSTNIKNTAFFGAGVVASFLGLGVLIPKTVYAITKKITGKDGFIALEQVEEKDVKNC